MSQKVLSLRDLKKKSQSTQTNNTLETLKINPLGLSLLGFALISEIYLIGKYYGKDVTANWSILLVALGMIGLMGGVLLRKGKFFTYELSFIKSGWQGLKYLLGVFGLISVIAIMMVVLRVSFRYALELIDTYFYYLAAAEIEEIFFRWFLISLWIILLSRYLGRTGAIIMSVVLSSLLFMIAHWSIYGHSAYLMTSMFFGGILFSIFYLAFKDITITMLGHLIINLIVVSTTMVV